MAVGRAPRESPGAEGRSAIGAVAAGNDEKATMNSFTQDVRDEMIRGVILSILIKHQLDWVTFHALKVQVQRGQGFALEDSELKFQLAYLSDSARGYIENKPLRAGRGGTEFSFVRATAKAVDLRDGRLAPDAGVAF